MYQFSKNLKLTAFGLIIVGLLGIGYGFYSAPPTVEEAKAMVAHGDDHGNDHVAFLRCVLSSSIPNSN